jgi:hypothetical protein
MRAALILPTLVFLLVGCPSNRGDDCGGCAEDEFCCLGVCTKLGERCGAQDAGSADSAGDQDVEEHDATTKPCAPPTPGAIVESGCDGDDVITCSTGAVKHRCNKGYSCTPWLDPKTGSWIATCLSSGTDPCDPSMPDRCEQQTMVRCIKVIAPNHPPGQLSRVDCEQKLAPGATCVLEDGNARCHLEGVPPCTVGQFTITCVSASERSICVDGYQIARDCGTDLGCFETGPWGALCLPASATKSFKPATGSQRGLHCVDTKHLRVQQYGYEWTKRCKDKTVIGGPSIKTVCYDATGEARCEAVGTQHCDPKIFTASCSPDLTTSTSCQGDVVYEQTCRHSAKPGICDPATGRCVKVQACTPGDTNLRCVADGQWKTICGLSGVEEVVPCKDCDDSSGFAVCGS